jgi:mannose-1-phosphate guanylyltransferase
LKLLKPYGITAVVLSVGYLSQCVMDEFMNDDEGLAITFSDDDRPLGTGGSIKNAERFFTEDFLIVNGDTYSDIDYRQLMSDHKASRAMLTIVATDQHKNKGGVLLMEQGRVTGFIRNPHEDVQLNSFRHAGVYAASPRLFQYIPESMKVSLERETIPLLIQTRPETVSPFIVHQEFIDVGSFSSYEEAQAKLK